MTQVTAPERTTYDRAMSAELSTMTTPDGRLLEYLVTGPAEGPALLFHVGTPSSAVDFSGVTGPAAALGLRTITYSRPGYGASTERPGRSVADAVEDVSALLDELGVTEFRAFGWSGGGPHALACAALLPGRCRAAAVLASPAPYTARDLDFMAGMGQDNVEEFAAAIAGFDELDALLQPMLGYFGDATADSLAEALDGLLAPVDKAALAGAFGGELAMAARRAVATGTSGWRDDDLAFVSSWGFGVSDITVPVAVWYGSEDRMVPFAHGAWLAAEIPAADDHALDGEGHLSMIARMDTILGDLVSHGGS
jgi:pimeloyl-ACP methyl ester carboxylesterase